VQARPAVVDRHIVRFVFDVPQGHIDPAYRVPSYRFSPHEKPPETRLPRCSILLRVFVGFEITKFLDGLREEEYRHFTISDDVRVRGNLTKRAGLLTSVVRDHVAPVIFMRPPFSLSDVVAILILNYSDDTA
jgi:hypothetical protein